MLPDIELAKLNYRISDGKIMSRHKDEFLHSVKNKLREALLAKTGVSKNTFSWCLDNADDNTYPTPLKVGTVTSGSGETSEFACYFEKTSLDIEFLFRYVFVFVLDETGSVIAEGDINKLLFDIYTEFNDMNYVDDESEDYDINLEPYVRFVEALAKASEGHYSEALKEETVDDFIEDIIDIYGGEDILEKWFVLENLYLFLYPMIYGCEDYLYSVNLFSDKETYLYKSYRQYVPEDIRVRVDKALALVDEPFSGIDDDWGAMSVIGDMDKTGYHVVVYMTYFCSDQELTTRDMNPFVGDACRYLQETLPELRKTYMEGRPDGSSFHSLFFMSGCFFGLCQFVRVSTIFYIF